MEGTNGKGAIQASVSLDPENTSLSEMDLDEVPSLARPGERPSRGTKRGLDATDVAEDPVSKRLKPERKIGDDISVEIWRRVFLYLSPAMLCRCLLVSKKFNQALTGSTKSNGQTVDSETIWTVSRRSYTDLPRPLSNLSELQMLRLIGGLFCQLCHVKPKSQLPIKPWSCGPGPVGVRVIWPLGLRICGSCLDCESLKVCSLTLLPERPDELQDTQVLQDSSISSLRLGVPHGYRTPDMHFISESVRKQQGQISPHLRVSRIYFKKHLKVIRSEYEHAVSFGEAATEEWRKGLQDKGKRAMLDSARWEEWEIKVGLGDNLINILRKYDASSFSSRNKEIEHRSIAPAASQLFENNHGKHPLPKPVFSLNTPYELGPSEISTAFAQHPVRSRREAEEARDARMLDIVHHCSLLDPPITCAVLERMPSFQEAKKITTPLTPKAWEVLKKFLLKQRAKAQAEEDQHQQDLAIRGVADMTSYVPTKREGTTDTARWESTLKTLCHELDRIAYECIRVQIPLGGINKHNVAKFAADALCRVFDRFHEEKQQGTLAKAPLELIFSINAMRFVNDKHVRPLTQNICTKLFLCSGCESQEKQEYDWFSLRGLLDHHYRVHAGLHDAAEDVSMGWARTAWPKKPFFRPDPERWLSRGDSSATKLIVLESAHLNRTHSEHRALAKIAQDKWNSLSGVKDLMKCVRLQVTIHHTAKAFQLMCLRRPTLDNFASALDDYAQIMEPLNRPKDLACAQCLKGYDLPKNQSYFARIEQVRLWNLRDLVTHWQHCHSVAIRDDQSHWSNSMIEVPLSQLQDLMHHPGMDDAKLKMIADAFPSAFPCPLPSMDSIIAPDSTKVDSKKDDLAQRVIIQAAKKRTKSNLRKKKVHNGCGTSHHKSLEGSSPEINEDEYDPRRPSIPSSQRDNPGPECYDTDARKSPAMDPKDAEKLNNIPLAFDGTNNRSAVEMRRGGFTPPMGSQSTGPTPRYRTTDQPDIGAILADVLALQNRATDGHSAIADHHISKSSQTHNATQSFHERNTPITYESDKFLPNQSHQTLSHNYRVEGDKFGIRTTPVRTNELVMPGQPYSQLQPPSMHHVGHEVRQSITLDVRRDPPFEHIQEPPEYRVLSPSRWHSRFPVRKIFRDVNGNEFEAVVRSDSFPVSSQPLRSSTEYSQPMDDSVAYGGQRSHDHGHVQFVRTPIPAYSVHVAYDPVQQSQFLIPVTTNSSPPTYENVQVYDRRMQTQTPVRFITNQYEQTPSSRVGSRQASTSQGSYNQLATISGRSEYHGRYPEYIYDRMADASAPRQ